MAFVKVANTGDVKPNEGRPVSVNGLEIALFNVGGQFHAIENTCPHKGGPLGEGVLEDGVVTCPLHGWRFDVTTGKNVAMPVNVRAFAVRVEGNDVLVYI